MQNPRRSRGAVIGITMRSPLRSWPHRSSLRRPLRSRYGNYSASCVRRPSQRSSSSGFMPDTTTLPFSIIGSTITAPPTVPAHTGAGSTDCTTFITSDRAVTSASARRSGTASSAHFGRPATSANRRARTAPQRCLHRSHARPLFNSAQSRLDRPIYHRPQVFHR